MNSLERFYRARHLDGALVKAPIKGSAVREAHDELAKLTDELTRVRDRFEQARGAARDCAARVRDATVAAKGACKKARIALLARDVAVDVAPEGESRRALLERCEQLIARGRQAGVKLGDLVAARDALVTRMAEALDAEDASRTATRAHREAGSAWDGGYSALRSTCEATLRRAGSRGEALDAALERYFPSRVERSSPEKPPATPPSLPASGSPLLGPEGTKAA